MSNPLVLPILALVLALLGALLPLRSPDPPPVAVRVRAGAGVCAAFLVLFLIATLVWPQVFVDGASIALALAMGSAASVLAEGAGRSRPGFAIGLTVLGIALLPFVGVGAGVQIAFIVGAFLGAFTTASREASGGGRLATIAAVAVVGADLLGRYATRSDSPAAATGSLLGIALLLAIVVSGVVARSSASRLITEGLGFIVLLAAGFAACAGYLASAQLAGLWVGGAVVGVIVHLVLAGENEPEPFRFVLCAVIWLAAATVAFGLGLGYGMAVALLAGFATLALFGSTRGVMTLSVALAILIYRFFREMHPEESKALDIGQHYTMVGMAIGALVPLMPLEWRRDWIPAGWRAVAARALWAVILLGIPVAAAVFLGSKGAIGMIVGLSLAAVVEGLRGNVGLETLNIGVGVGGVTTLMYGWLGDWTDIDRGAKMKAVVVVAIVALVVAAALMGISRSSQESQRS